MAVVDSGIAEHQDVGVGPTSRVIVRKSFVPTEPETTGDLYGHGTHVAGIIAGDGARSAAEPGAFNRLHGVAPTVQLISLKVLDKNGEGNDLNVLRAMQWAIQNRERYNIRVINLSLGRPVKESYTMDPLGRAVEAAWRNGIVVVVSAGNWGRSNLNGMGGYGTYSAVPFKQFKAPTDYRV